MGEQTKRIGIARMLLAGSLLLALAAMAGILVLDFSLHKQGGLPAAAASPLPSPPEAQAAQGVVHALMFWKPGCQHCEMTIQTVLPPIQQAYGAALDLRMFRVESAEDIEAFFRVAESLGIQPEAAGVPFLVIGDQVLIGTDNISARLPGLIEMHLAAGGVDLPDTPPLSTMLAERGELPTFPDLGSIPQEPLSPQLATQVGSGGTAGSRPEGFALAGGILAGMSLALLYALAAVFSTRVPVPPSSWTERLLPLAGLAGLGVAAYLAYVETRLVQAYCGPLGDCNAVQSSPYARLFGILPVGALGDGRLPAGARDLAGPAPGWTAAGAPGRRAAPRPGVHCRALFALPDRPGDIRHPGGLPVVPELGCSQHPDPGPQPVPAAGMHEDPGRPASRGI